LVQDEADPSYRVVASVGRLEESAEISTRFVFARSHVPQGQVLPHAALVVTTGHSTSFLGAAVHGVPLVVVPHGSGTEDVADLVTELGIGRTHHPAALTAGEVQRTILEVVGDPAIRARSRSLAASIPSDGCRRAAKACASLTL
jgi:UDP:flavonoid glycosyltransferase YjiC (YdhE family)